MKSVIYPCSKLAVRCETPQLSHKLGGRLAFVLVTLVKVKVLRNDKRLRLEMGCENSAEVILRQCVRLARRG